MTRKSSITIVASIFMMLISLLGTIHAANAGTWQLEDGCTSSEVETITKAGSTSTNTWGGADFNPISLDQNYRELSGTMDVRYNYSRELKENVRFIWVPTNGEFPNTTPNFYNYSVTSTFTIDVGDHQCGNPMITQTLGPVVVYSNDSKYPECYTAEYNVDIIFSVRPHNPAMPDCSWYFTGNEKSLLTVPS